MHQYQKTVGPYCFVSRDESRTFETPEGPRTFRFVCYGAYNALGLIGSECNGIAVLDEDRMSVLCDEIHKALSGYHQPTLEAREFLAEVQSCDWATFKDFINTNERTRYQLTE